MESLTFLMITSHFPPNHLGGDAMMVKYLSDELVKRGHNVYVFHDPSIYSALKRTPPSVSDESGTDGLHLHTLSHPRSRLGVGLGLSLNMTGRAAGELRNLAERIKPDVIHWHNIKGLIGRPFDIGTGPSFYTAHDYFLSCPRSNLERPGWVFCTRPKACILCTLRWRKPPQLWRAGPKRVIQLPRAMRVLTPSAYMASRLREDGIKTSAVLRNFVPDVAKDSRIGDNGRSTIVYVGAIERHKGPHALLEAFARCRDRQGFSLRIVGEGSMRSALQRRTAELAIGARVELPGFLPREGVERILKDSAAMVVPSEWAENAPLTALEALAFGVPVIGSDMGGLPEIADADAGSAVFRAGDVSSLEEALVSQWETKRAPSYGMKARRAYETRYSPQVYMDQYLSLVRKGKAD